jgi:hypothetical protein
MTRERVGLSGRAFARRMAWGGTPGSGGLERNEIRKTEKL